MTELSPTQMEALTLYMNRQALGITQKQIAEQFQVSDRQLRRWISSDEGKEFITGQAIAVAKESLNDVLSVLTKKALEGKVPKWTELWLKTMGILNASEMEVNVNQPDDSRSNESINSEIALLKKQLGIEDNAEPKKQPLKKTQDEEIETLLAQLKATEKPSLQ
ncbi:phBC6A51 family helix-turn-helix protein [Paenibacillus solisilvae]|uniref:PhBC6A51 family helix-turn-helix protein n=1 Tax=Paenibacillus solisilvae TaxID=2486751 RepID=A0ABW0VPL8_9BACL